MKKKERIAAMKEARKHAIKKTMQINQIYEAYQQLESRECIPVYIDEEAHYTEEEIQITIERLARNVTAEMHAVDLRKDIQPKLHKYTIVLREAPEEVILTGYFDESEKPATATMLYREEGENWSPHIMSREEEERAIWFARKTLQRTRDKTLAAGQKLAEEIVKWIIEAKNALEAMQNGATKILFYGQTYTDKDDLTARAPVQGETP